MNTDEWRIFDSVSNAHLILQDDEKFLSLDMHLCMALKIMYTCIIQFVHSENKLTDLHL